MIANNSILQGNTLEILKTLPSDLINCCVTSPPYYGLRSYLPEGHPDKALEIGMEESPEAYVSKLVEVFREVRRVLKDEGTLWLNLGDSYNSQGSMGCSSNVSLPQNGMGYIKREIKSLKHKDLIGIPWLVAFALRADGWYLRSDIIWHKPNCMPESCKDRPTKSHEYMFLLSKKQKYYYDSIAIQEESITKDPRKPYTSQGAKELDGRDVWHSGEKRENGDFTKRNKRTVWTIPTKPIKAAHFATFPEKLVEPCILAGCPEGGTVLDPFFGAGTVGLVSAKLGRRWIGIELNPNYCEIARKRISALPKKLTDFAYKYHDL
jgi:DNA modification methylase